MFQSTSGVYCEFSSFQLAPRFIRDVEHRHVRKRICETTVRFRWKKFWHEKISGYARMDIIFRDRWALIVRDSHHKESHRVIHLSILERIQNASHTARTGDSNDEIINWMENDWDCSRHHLDLFPLGKSVCRLFWDDIFVKEYFTIYIKWKIHNEWKCDIITNTNSWYSFKYILF